MSLPHRWIIVTGILAAYLSLVMPAHLAAEDGRSQEVTYHAPGAPIYSDSSYGWQYGQPDLFYNFYVPNHHGGAPAQLYIAPRPVPARVGHTYYTYQPLMPHEFTYQHHRTYRRYYDDGRGMTRTRAIWYANPVTSAAKTVRQAVRIPR